MADFRSAEKHATLEMLLLAPYLLKECHRLLSTVVKYHSTRQDTHSATFCPVSFCCTWVSSLIHENYRFLDARQLDVTDVERSGRCHVKMSSATSRIWRFASRIDGNGIPSYRSMRCNLRWQMAKVNSVRVFPGHVRTSFAYATRFTRTTRQSTSDRANSFCFESFARTLAAFVRTKHIG